MSQKLTYCFYYIFIFSEDVFWQNALQNNSPFAKMRLSKSNRNVFLRSAFQDCFRNSASTIRRTKGQRKRNCAARENLPVSVYYPPIQQSDPSTTQCRGNVRQALFIKILKAQFSFQIDFASA